MNPKKDSSIPEAGNTHFDIGLAPIQSRKQDVYPQEIVRFVDSSVCMIHTILKSPYSPEQRKQKLLDVIYQINIVTLDLANEILSQNIETETRKSISSAVFALFFAQIRALVGLSTDVSFDELVKATDPLIIGEIYPSHIAAHPEVLRSDFFNDKQGVQENYRQHHGKKNKYTEELFFSVIRKLGKQMPHDFFFQGKVEVEVIRGALIFYIQNTQDFAAIPGTVVGNIVARGIYYSKAISDSSKTGPTIFIKGTRGSAESRSIRTHELVHRDDVFLWAGRVKRYEAAHREILAFMSQSREASEVEALLLNEKGFYFPSQTDMKKWNIDPEEYKQNVRFFIQQAYKVGTRYPNAGLYLLASTPIGSWHNLTL